jgi:beta-phosphoglucomutase-like phosphatase (HAD superfamily)
MGGFVLHAGTSAVLFDLDGTLANTDPLHAEAWYQALLEVTGHRLDRSEYMRQCVRGNLSPIEYIGSLGFDVPADELRARKADHYERLVRERLQIRDGTSELIRALQDVPIAMGIVSSSSLSSVEIFLRLCWPGPPPATVVSRDDRIPRKPSPDPYQLAVRRLGSAAQASVAIENSPSGIESAKAAGLGCIAVVTEDFLADELAAADVVVSSFTGIQVRAGGDGVVTVTAEAG